VHSHTAQIALLPDLRSHPRKRKEADFMRRTMEQFTAEEKSHMQAGVVKAHPA